MSERKTGDTPLRRILLVAGMVGVTLGCAVIAVCYVLNHS